MVRGKKPIAGDRARCWPRSGIRRARARRIALAFAEVAAGYRVPPAVAAVIMTIVAQIIPPFAAIVANVAGAVDRRK